MSARFYRSIELLKRKGKKNNIRVDRVERMIIKRDKLGGKVCGFHGTSETRAKKIVECGFKDCHCHEGGFGVYFWDEDFKDNALDFAKKRAEDDKDKKVAIIKVVAHQPEPDWLEGRPQWIAPANKIEVIQVDYIKL